MDNPYAGTDLADPWQIGYQDGFNEPLVDHPGLMYIDSALAAYREGEDSGRQEAAAANQPEVPVDMPPPEVPGDVDVLNPVDVLGNLPEIPPGDRKVMAENYTEIRIPDEFHGRTIREDAIFSAHFDANSDTYFVVVQDFDEVEPVREITWHLVVDVFVHDMLHGMKKAGGVLGVLAALLIPSPLAKEAFDLFRNDDDGATVAFTVLYDG